MSNSSSRSSAKLALVPQRNEPNLELIAGLSQEQKCISAKFLYDTRGFELFERIKALEDYYLSHTELSILREFGPEIAELFGRSALMVEAGSGSGQQFRMLMRHLQEPWAYVPMDVSAAALDSLAKNTKKEFPLLQLYPVCSDVTAGLALPEALMSSEKKRIFLAMGSLLGKFEPELAASLLRRASRLAKAGGGLLVGVDLKKDPWALLRAYEDSQGLNASLHFNLLTRLNREFSATFDSRNFYHEVLYNQRLGCVETHLVSRLHQLVQVAGQRFLFQPGETIRTDSSYVYNLSEFPMLARSAGWALRRFWRDRNRLFALFYFELADNPNSLTGDSPRA